MKNSAMKLLSSLGILLLIPFLVQAAGTHKTPVAPAEYLAMENPIDMDDVDAKFMKKVKRLYKSKCKKCHGIEGDGQGSAAADMVLKPTAFTTPGYFDRKDGQLFWIIKEGSKGTEMKAFGPGTDVNLSDEEMWKLIAYMRTKFAQ